MSAFVPPPDAAGEPAEPELEGLLASFAAMADPAAAARASSSRNPFGYLGYVVAASVFACIVAFPVGLAAGGAYWLALAGWEIIQ